MGLQTAGHVETCLLVNMLPVPGREVVQNKLLEYRVSAPSTRVQHL